MTDPVVVAITGASGAAYGVRLLEVLAQNRVPVWLIVSSHGARLLKAECDIGSLEELQAATRSYLSTRLAASGGPSSARATILDAMIIEERRPGQSSLGAPFRNTPDATIKGRVEVKLAIIGVGGTELGFASAKIERARSLPNVSTVPERERLAQEMIREMIVELDKALSNSVRQNLSAYLTL